MSRTESNSDGKRPIITGSINAGQAPGVKTERSLQLFRGESQQEHQRNLDDEHTFGKAEQPTTQPVKPP
jgi:hypothetical protein